ncbi:MAG: hypothetical protein ACK5UX_00220 [Burkholderiales bacterium]|jgi:hypothetical protein|nr:hypothetical protein [Nitrosomonadaceae bacterium]
MSEIKNYTMNFSSGRSQCDLNVLRTLAFTEIHRLLCAKVSGFGKVEVK